MVNKTFVEMFAQHYQNFVKCFKNISKFKMNFFQNFNNVIKMFFIQMLRNHFANVVDVVGVVLEPLIYSLKIICFFYYFILLLIRYM